MKMLLAIAFGGAVGSVGRYYIADIAERWFVSFLGVGFPFGTLTVNVLGSFVFGALIESFAATVMPSAELRALLFIGVLGSFTTFSAFSSDMFLLFERGEIGRALLYIFASVGISLGAFFAGLRLLRLILT
ncbi:MAG: fluoride efflux transporter CrcB [Rhodospirillaceae bacterium]|jgi:fluoride exporter|nr:fluoride efflux transporter CrcB [Rhodospirillaceae bacterium]MBT3627794.1 fluoride efflux transporter CrcB [Rhodospirillaceae bacterium]MBT3926666.1 fluoride efflux transporter CrcB [Rhodospirillaceae bacterium]MBT4426044.1 fluoride efflux transporter CrcB [Rhodospirillaceae bacterium]MBT5038235.1 fluoride efflux transporter CrcB [Rhodospirillaceae bacterium]